MDSLSRDDHCGRSTRGSYKSHRNAYFGRRESTSTPSGHSTASPTFLTVQIRNPRVPEMQESGLSWTRVGAYATESERIYLVDLPNVSNKQTLNF